MGSGKIPSLKEDYDLSIINLYLFYGNLIIHHYLLLSNYLSYSDISNLLELPLMLFPPSSYLVVVFLIISLLDEP